MATYGINEKKELQDIESLKLTILEAMYPVGSIYCTVENKNPADLFGFGDWSRVAQGRSLVGVSSDSNVTDKLRRPRQNVGMQPTANGVVKFSVNTVIDGNNLPMHMHNVCERDYVMQASGYRESIIYTEYEPVEADEDSQSFASMTVIDKAYDSPDASDIPGRLVFDWAQGTGHGYVASDPSCRLYASKEIVGADGLPKHHDSRKTYKSSDVTINVQNSGYTCYIWQRNA